jgi:RNA polymerase sigma-70 factor (ECF subfamily)
MLERCDAAADDLLQDTVEHALRGARGFKPGTNVRSWLHRIMTNAFIDRCRSRWRFVHLDDDCEEPGSQETYEPPAWVDLAMADVAEAANSLEEPLRTTFQLGCVDRLPYRTVAERLAIPITTVGTRLLRARAKVRRRLLERLPPRKVDPGDWA